MKMRSLLIFEFSNIYSYYNTNHICMIPDNADKELDEINTFYNNTKLNKSLIILGKTQSGKSNAFNALKDLRKILVNDESDESTTSIINVPNNKFYKQNNDKAQQYSLYFVDGKTYYYQLIIKEGKVEYEKLESLDENDKWQNIFTRCEDWSYKIGINKTYNHNLEGLTKEMTFVNHLIWDGWCQDKLSIFDDVERLYKFIKDLKFIDKDVTIDNVSLIIDKHPEYLDNATKILQENCMRNLTKLEVIKMSLYYLRDAYFATYKNWNNEESYAVIPYDDKLNYIISQIIILEDALHNNKIIIYDDFDKYLDLDLAIYLIDCFNSIDRNKENSQLIATIHNQNIIDYNLRADQICFSERDKHGQSKLVYLSEFRTVADEYFYSQKYEAGFFDLVNLEGNFIK